MVVQPLLGLLLPGVYRDVTWIKATWFGNDLITLLVAAPILVVSQASVSRGSRRARLVWLGVQGYAVYNFAYYLLGAALNAFFPLYVLASVVSVLSLIFGLAGTDVAFAARQFSARTPVRSIGGYYTFVAAGLSAVWLGTWAAYIFAERPTPVEPEVFRLVAALDLTIIVTALAAGGVLLWRRNDWGFVISPIAGILASLYLSVLTLNSTVAVIQGIVQAPGELPIWGTLLVPTTAATVLLLIAAGKGNSDGAQSRDAPNQRIEQTTRLEQ